MATTAAQRKHKAKLEAMARARRMLNAKKKGEPLIPDAVIKKLAALRISEANGFIYEACLEKLIREA